MIYATRSAHITEAGWRYYLLADTNDELRVVADAVGANVLWLLQTPFAHCHATGKQRREAVKRGAKILRPEQFEKLVMERAAKAGQGDITA